MPPSAPTASSSGPAPPLAYQQHHPRRWEYRSRTLRPASAEAVLAGSDISTEGVDSNSPYSVVDEAHAALRAKRQMEAHDITGRSSHATGTWRRQAPGTQFSLSQNPDTDAQSLTCPQVAPREGLNNCARRLQAGVRLSQVIEIKNAGFPLSRGKRENLSCSDLP